MLFSPRSPSSTDAGDPSPFVQYDSVVGAQIGPCGQIERPDAAQHSTAQGRLRRPSEVPPGYFISSQPRR